MAHMAEMGQRTPAMWEREYWNGVAGERWSRFQAEIDRALEPFTRALLESAALRPGEHVLDVGCGCGDTTLGAASQVGPGGSATGIDLSTAMLARARERAGAVPEIRFVCGDASASAFDRRFDACLSRFGVMFFLDPVAAFRHLREALRPAGRMAFVCWRGLDENPWITIPLRAAAQAAGRAPEEPSPGAPGPFAFADRARVEAILGDAGFSAVDVRAFDAEVVVSTTGLDDAVTLAAQMGPAGRFLAEISPEARETGVRAIAGALHPHLREGAVRLGGATWVVTARAP
jgi:SAM-dependent methyltransferase